VLEKTSQSDTYSKIVLTQAFLTSKFFYNWAFRKEIGFSEKKLYFDDMIILSILLRQTRCHRNVLSIKLLSWIENVKSIEN
jgi:hypothetical protein